MDSDEEYETYMDDKWTLLDYSNLVLSYYYDIDDSYESDDDSLDYESDDDD